MQKTNPGRKDQIRFNPRIGLIINSKHANHWFKVKIKPGLIFPPWIRFLHTAMSVLEVDGVNCSAGTISRESSEIGHVDTPVNKGGETSPPNRYIQDILGHQYSQGINIFIYSYP